SAGDDVGEVVPVDVPRPDVDPAGLGRVEGEEAVQERPVPAAEHLDVGRGAGVGAHDHVAEAVVVDVGDGDVAAAEEGGPVGVEGIQRGPGRAGGDEDSRLAALAGDVGDVRDAVAVDVTHRRADLAGEAGERPGEGELLVVDHHRRL